MTFAAWYVEGSRVTYFDGTVNHTTDRGTILRVADDGGLLIRWDNGLADTCECVPGSHPMGRENRECAGEWFGPRDVRPASAE